MKTKRIAIIYSIIYLIQLLALVFFALYTPESRVDMVAVNDICKSAGDVWPEVSSLDIIDTPDYVIIDHEENVLFRSAEGLNESIVSALGHRDLIVDIKKDDHTVGKLIVYNDQKELLEKQKKQAVMVLGAFLLVQCFVGVGYLFYIDHTVAKPFSRLKNFAQRISQGNLDIPLEMDRKNFFGPFTESFDLMRCELKKARLAEAHANADKKEMAAKLSHDIRTPVASIKATSELGLAVTQEEKTGQRFSQIILKADQINALTTNLLSAALDELQQLDVKSADINSQEILPLLKNADYLNRSKLCEIPDGMIMADKLRLQQVFDNIFANSYKYADTKIHVISGKNEEGIYITVEDEGGGVAREELPLLTQKFYRGPDTEDKEGAGLGLYISYYFMKEMKGNLLIENGKTGLKITVFLAFSG